LSTSSRRLIYPTPHWDDLVELALDEIRAFGVAGPYQVRLARLLTSPITQSA
jgi:hypothetical protein